ncbi:hypothetical protein A2U01_0042139, partial [Trifolium medium]|nr:hypothetical protein [Trifolium medium]
HIADFTEEENWVEVERYQDYAVRVYLLLLVGYTIFTDTSKCPPNLPEGLSTTAAPGAKVVTGYMTLLQVEDERYNEAQPAANKYIPKNGLTSITAYRLALDRTLGFDITWAPYGQHRVARPLEDI